MSATVIKAHTICDAIARTYRNVSGLDVQSYNQLTDGVPQTPLLQLWWESFNEDTANNSSQSAPGRAVVTSDDGFVGRLFAAPRTELHRDVPAAMDVIEEIRRITYAQGTPYFGMAEIKSFKWRAERTNWKLGTDQLYAGAKIFWTIRIF